MDDIMFCRLRALLAHLTRLAGRYGGDITLDEAQERVRQEINNLIFNRKQ